MARGVRGRDHGGGCTRTLGCRKERTAGGVRGGDRGRDCRRAPGYLQGASRTEVEGGHGLSARSTSGDMAARNRTGQGEIVPRFFCFWPCLTLGAGRT